MQNKIKKVLSVLIVFSVIFSFSACQKAVNETPENKNVQSEKTPEASGLWEKATYTEDSEFGNGKTTVKVEVKAEEKSVTFTLKTDKTFLGDALLEHGLISGEESDYGLYITAVNGISADYNLDQSYWAFYKNGAMMTVGVDGEKVKDGEHYELVYTK